MSFVFICNRSSLRGCYFLTMHAKERFLDVRLKLSSPFWISQSLLHWISTRLIRSRSNFRTTVSKDPLDTITGSCDL